MSKSKKNTIDPENIIQNYGADAARLFILSDSPPEKDVQWTDEGIICIFRNFFICICHVVFVYFLNHF